MFSSSESDFNDISDEENFVIVVRVRKEKRIRWRTDHFNYWDDEEFFDRFRMSKRSTYIVLEQIRSKIENKTNWNSSNRKYRRSSGANLLALRSNSGTVASAAGSMATIYNVLGGSGDSPLRSTQFPPSAISNPQGLFSISHLNMEISEQHIGNNSRLEITCLATIPTQVGLGEQYADYKTYSVKVEVERPETSSATSPPNIGMAALGNGSFACSIHTWPVKILLSCLIFLRI